MEEFLIFVGTLLVVILVGFPLSIGYAKILNGVNEELACEQKNNVYDCVSVEYFVPAPVKVQ